MTDNINTSDIIVSESNISNDIGCLINNEVCKRNEVVIGIIVSIIKSLLGGKKRTPCFDAVYVTVTQAYSLICMISHTVGERILTFFNVITSFHFLIRRKMKSRLPHISIHWQSKRP